MGCAENQASPIAVIENAYTIIHSVESLVAVSLTIGPFFELRTTNKAPNETQHYPHPQVMTLPLDCGRNQTTDLYLAVLRMNMCCIGATPNLQFAQAMRTHDLRGRPSRREDLRHWAFVLNIWDEISESKIIRCVNATCRGCSNHPARRAAT